MHIKRTYKTYMWVDICVGGLCVIIYTQGFYRLNRKVLSLSSKNKTEGTVQSPSYPYHDKGLYLPGFTVLLLFVFICCCCFCPRTLNKA